MSVLYVLGLAVGILMGVLVWTAWRRWPVLNSGQRWIARGVGVFFGLFVVAYPMVLLRMKTRLVQELPILVGTLCIMAGFAAWQPRPIAARVVHAAMVLFGGLWIAAQVIQGLENNFSTVSGPIHGALIAAAGSVTLIAYAQAGAERWTDQPWFWMSVGLMLVYGTEVLLDPLLHRIFRVRDDLVNFAFAFHQVCSIIGYCFVLRGFTQTGGSHSADANAVS